MRIVVVLFLSFAISSCFKFEQAKDAMIMLRDDTLLKLHFQRLLASNGIKYSIREDGYYISEKKNLATMEALVSEAAEQLKETIEKDLDSICVAQKLQQELEGILFVINQSDKGLVLKAAASTYDEHKISIVVSTATLECQGDV